MKSSFDVEGKLSFNSSINAKILKVIDPTKANINIPMNKAIHQGFTIIGKDLIKIARTKMGTTAIDNSKPWKPSFPGRFPAIQSGNLYKNINFNILPSYEMEFGTNVLYGKYLQTGTRTKTGTTKMLPRPWLELTHKSEAPQLPKIMGNIVNEYLK